MLTDDPFANLSSGPYKAPHVCDVPGILPSAWERQARPWERRTPHPPSWWFERAEEWARAALDALPEAANRFGSYAVACRRRGEVEQMIRDRRTPAIVARRPTTGRIAGALARGELYLLAAVWREPEPDPLWEEWVSVAQLPAWGEVAPLGAT